MTTEENHAAGDAPGPPAVSRRPIADEGGDSACWLHRVCPHCDAIADEDPPAECPRCHRPITG